MEKIPVLEVFADATSAQRFLENVLWAEQPACPRCRRRGHGRKLGGRSRPNCFKCYACRHTFSVRFGTVFERSRLPLNQWLQAIYLTDGGSMAVRPRRLGEILGISRPTAQAMLHRLQAGPSHGLVAIRQRLAELGAA